MHSGDLEWDSIKNSISDLTNKLEHLPNDLKHKAVQLLNERLISDDAIEGKRTSRLSNKSNQQNETQINTSRLEIDLDNGDSANLNEQIYLIEANEALEYIDREEMENIEIEIVHDSDIKQEPEDTYTCHLCDFIGLNEQTIMKHVKVKHKKRIEIVCHTCGKVLPSIKKLKVHLSVHVKEDNAELKLMKKDAKFECELCGACLRSRPIYMEHIGRHFNRQRKTCDICGKLFPNSSQLNAHKLNHEPPKMPCFICGKKFRDKFKLGTHLHIHSGQKDYTCPECPYATYVKHNLQKHCLKQHNLNYPPVRQSIKRFHPDEVETSMLSDPVARTYINKIKKSGECLPLKFEKKEVVIKLGKRKQAQMELLQQEKKYAPSELIISNEVEIVAETKIKKERKIKKAYIKKKKSKYPVIKKENYPRIYKKGVHSSEPATNSE